MKSIRLLAPAVALAALCLTGCTTGIATAPTTTARADGEDVGVIHDYALPEITTVSDDYEIAVLQAHRSDAYAQSAAQAVENYAEELGVTVTVQDAGGYDGVAVQKQIAQIEAATARGVDAIVIWSTDPNAIIPSLEAAKDKGIKIIAWSQAPDFPGADATVTGDFEQDGFTMASALFARIGGEGRVVSVFGGAGSAYQAALAAGFERAVKEFPDIEVVGTTTIDDFSPVKVQDIVENNLTRDPTIRGFVTTTGQMAAAATQTIDSMGLGQDTFAVGEIVGDCTQIDLLRAGKLPILLGVPAVYSGQLVLATTVQLLEGETVPASQIIPGNIYTPSNIDGAPLELEVEPEFLEGCL